LIGQSRGMADMTPERIGKVFGERLRRCGSGNVGRGEDISGARPWNMDRRDAVGGNPLQWVSGSCPDPGVSSPVVIRRSV